MVFTFNHNTSSSSAVGVELLQVLRMGETLNPVAVEKGKA